MRRREFITLLGAAAWPYSAAAQTANKRPVLGILLQGTPEQRKGLRLAQSFFNGLRDLGYVQNRDFDIVSRLAASTSDLDKAAEELVRLNPDVILAGASANALALKKATSTIPIVVAALGNTVALGLNARDTRRPTGNVTGIMPYVEGLPSKQLELAREIIPGAQKIGIVNDTSDAKAGPQWEEINATATRFDINIAGADAHTTEAIEPAFARLRSDRVDVVVILQSNFLMFDRAQIGTAALAHRLPTVAGYRELVEAGALISYGVNLDSCFHRAATYVHRIMRGTTVADLPIEFPTRLELVINLQTVKKLGLEIPPTLLARADEVIE